MRIPDPKAVTAEEAYLGYKAEIIEESELKPSLYEPYLHFDAWLAYWCGLTNTYPTDENGNPEMLCDEEALVAYLSGVTDTYPEEIKDPYDVRITGYLRYLCSYRFGRPEYPVTNSEFYLSLLDAPHTSNETPSADIELDTSEGKLIDVKAYGDTTQETLTGKNLLATSLDTLKYINTLGTWTNNVYVYNGITYTVNDDLTIDVNGSAAENAPSYFIINNTSSLTASTDYILNGCPPDGGVQSYSIRLYDSGAYTSDTGSGLSFTYGTQNLVRINIFGGTTVTNKLFKPMIRLATVTDDTYEKFVGGIPSPNPDYPQDIQVVTGEQTVKFNGKNILPITMQNQTLNGITYTVNEDKSITMSGTATSRSEPRLYQAVPGAPTVVLKSGVTYHNSMDTILYWYSNNYHAVEPGGNYTPVADELIQFAFVRVENGETVNTTIYPQLEQGSTATSYEPYQSQDYTVDLGSTELAKIGNYQDYIYKSGDGWYVHKETGDSVLKGTEDWILGQNLTNTSHFIISDLTTIFTGAAVPPNDTTLGYCLSDHFEEKANLYNIDQVGIDFHANKNLIVSVPNSISTTTANFKTWLISNNTLVYYRLATPTDTKITDSTLISQLEDLAGADTYNEKTYIKVTANDPNLPALLKVEAYKY